MYIGKQLNYLLYFKKNRQIPTHQLYAFNEKSEKMYAVRVFLETF